MLEASGQEHGNDIRFRRRPYPFQGNGHLGFDCFQRYTKAVSNLLVGKAFLPAEVKDFPAFCREFVNGLQDDCPKFIDLQ